MSDRDPLVEEAMAYIGKRLVEEALVAPFLPYPGYEPPPLPPGVTFPRIRDIVEADDA